MAITVTQQHQYVKGNRREIIHNVLLDNSYPTGGYTFTGATAGMPSGQIDNVQIENGNGYRPQYDYTNSKIMVYTSAGTQTTNATDLSALTLRVTVTGR